MDPLPNDFRAPSTESGQDNYPPQQSQAQPQPQSAGHNAPRPALKEEEKNGRGEQDGAIADPEQNIDQGYFVNNLQSGQTLQQPVPIPQAIPPVPQIQPGTQAPWPPSYAATGPYTAAMQMERANSRMPTRDAYGNEIPPPPLSQNHSFPSPGRGIIRPNLQDLSTFGSAAAAASNVPGQPPRYDYLQHQQQQQQAYRQSLYYQPQMQFNVPGAMPGGIQPPDPQFPGQQPYPTIFQQPTNLQQFYRQDTSFNPYQPSLYGARERDNPYWQSLDPNGDTSYSSSITHHPQHSSSHGNAESFRFIRQINNNDVLCGRGGATNSHIGNRAFRHLVKQYKDKYLKAKKKEKPNVAGEIVDKIRSLDPPGRFLKKDRDTGYWLDIGDMRAKEKTSQALREGAPLIRRKLKEGALLADEEGGVTKEKESVDQDKSLGTVASETTIKEEDCKRKVISPVPQLPKMQIKEENEQDEESSSTPSPKRKKSTEPEESSAVEVKEGEKNDDDNASNPSAPTAPSAQNSSEDSEKAASPDDTKKGGDEDDDSLTSLTPTKGKMSKVNERDLTQDERDLYFNVFDPPRGLKTEAEEKGKSEETEDKNEVPPKS